MSAMFAEIQAIDQTIHRLHMLRRQLVMYARMQGGVMMMPPLPVVVHTPFAPNGMPFHAVPAPLVPQVVMGQRVAAVRHHHRHRHLAHRRAAHIRAAQLQQLLAQCRIPRSRRHHAV